VTSFLWNGHQLLLALRSRSVSTFPGHWAGISGYVEHESPLERAVIEIEEECGVDRCDVALRGEGEPFLVGEDARFRVHPFLFSVVPSCRPRRDWEAQRFQWVEVDDLLAGRIQPTVPKLCEGFRRVWPPWPVELAFGRNLDLARQWLREDRARGAGGLARCAARHVAKLARLVEDHDFDTYRLRLCEAAARLGAVRPSMAAPMNMMQDVADLTRQADSPADLIHKIESRVEAEAKAEVRAATRAADALPESSTVITISDSASVRRTLLTAKAKLAGVLVCEGRPLCEGRSLATELAREGIDVTLLTEAQVMLAMEKADFVLLGADTVLDSGDVINKVGSAMLALAAQTLNKPVWVVATTLKVARRPLPEIPQEENPTEEVWATPPAGVTVANLYFDCVAAALITSVWTETEHNGPQESRPSRAAC